MSELDPSRPRVPLGEDGHVAVDPTIARWRYLSFAVHRLTSNAFAPLHIGRSGHETAVVTLTGGALMTFDGRPPVRLRGRGSVFAGPPWAAYLPAGHEAALEPTGELAEVAVAEAPLSGRSATGPELVVLGPDAIRSYARRSKGAGAEVREIIGPDFPADRLMLFEVLVASGSWSFWPPHRHDRDDVPREAMLEEVDHYRFQPPEASGVQRIDRGSTEPHFSIRDGDTVFIADGYHAFAAGRDGHAYCLSVLAGDRRALASAEHPELGSAPPPSPTARELSR